VYLKSLELSGFKSFGKKSILKFEAPVTAVVGPNGSGKSNVVEGLRFVLGEQSVKSMRGRRGEDLVWGGSQALPRAGRATVKATLDNHARVLPLDYDEVVLERTVHRDGQNEYSINGSVVRLREIVELLAVANIGPSGHHIVSQGEADRVLSATPRERREIFEDALGLRSFEWKRAEAEKKLGKTAENVAQVEALRKELAPHLRFLKKQVEKVERASLLKADVAKRYRDYLRRESIYVSAVRKSTVEALRAPNTEREKLLAQIREREMAVSKSDERSESSPELDVAEKALAEARAAVSKATRELGSAEGELRAVERMAGKGSDAEGAPVPRPAVAAALTKIRESLKGAKAAGTVEAALAALAEAEEAIGLLLKGDGGGSAMPDTSALAKQVSSLRADLETAAKREQKASEEVSRLRAERDASRAGAVSAERELLSLVAHRGELERKIDDLARAAKDAERDEEEFRRELQEASALVGHGQLNYEKPEPGESAPSKEEILAEPRDTQVARRRELERGKLRLEELGGGVGDEVLKEHHEASSRDEFLGKELEDLGKSSETLKTLISDLEGQIHTRFDSGLKKVNEAFGELFALMFGGGEAKLVRTKIEKRKRADLEDMGASEPDEAEEAEEGVEVQVKLPRKRITGLVQLSGGERALTSIALLFAMSQVNPPPFVVLDETDAALDEANSRRYGDLIERLAKKSQLVLVTHNRETMSRAGALYGVTMASGVSELLSVRFEEAVAVAK